MSFFNARSMMHTFDELLCDVSVANLDIIDITELIHCDITNAEITIPGYSLFRQDIYI